VANLCDTCDRVSEVFQLPGRKDSNCVECSDDIAMLISLHALIKNATSQGESAAELETEAAPIIRRLTMRCQAGVFSRDSSRVVRVTPA
jgi:hypothetical protein